MTNILELPDDPIYTIKTVSTQTGVLSVTLRAWERRYDVLSPHRSENRYRLYSERDIAILTWLKSRVEAGISISAAVAELKQIQKNGNWPEAQSGAAVSRRLIPRQTTGEYARILYQALVKHQEETAALIMDEVFISYDLLIVFEKIMTPCLVEIGEGWYRGELRIATEHFASAFILGKLHTYFQSLPVQRTGDFIMLGCGPNEQHEIGSMMLAVLLRSEGYRVEYLGQDIPLEDLADYAQQEHPKLIILSASTEESALELQKVQGMLHKRRVKSFFGFGGRAFTINPALQKKIEGVYLGADLGQVVDTVGHLLRAAPEKPLR